MMGITETRLHDTKWVNNLFNSFLFPSRFWGYYTWTCSFLHHKSLLRLRLLNASPESGSEKSWAGSVVKEIYKLEPGWPLVSVCSWLGWSVWFQRKQMKNQKPNVCLGPGFTCRTNLWGVRCQEESFHALVHAVPLLSFSVTKHILIQPARPRANATFLGTLSPSASWLLSSEPFSQWVLTVCLSISPSDLEFFLNGG